MKYIKKLNIDFDQWNKLDDNLGWYNMKFVKGKKYDYYQKLYPVGTKVRIRKDSIYYDLHNPTVIGKIVDYFFNINYYGVSDRQLDTPFNYFIRVKWSTGYKNSYRIIDLEYYMNK
jgi:hypothetical protein